MAKKKGKNTNLYMPIKNPELLGGKKETQQQILARGSEGNVSNRDWERYIARVKQHAQAMKQVDKTPAQKQPGKENQQKLIDHDKDR